jgi:dihydroorotase
VGSNFLLEFFFIRCWWIGVWHFKYCCYPSGKINEEAKDTIDAKGLTVLPGCIDTQTHFREPGSTDTEDLHSGSRAAIAGGITAVFEMPNTNPPTSNKKEFQRKLDLAKNRMYCNYAFYFGATADNANDLADLKNLEGCCGIKLFFGILFYSMLVDWCLAFQILLLSLRQNK